MRLSWETGRLRPEHPFRISRSTRREVGRVWVRVEADGEVDGRGAGAADGATGRGEAAPTDYYGESVESVVAALERIRPVLAREEDPEAIERTERAMERAAPDAPAARAAVSAALHDLVGRRLGRPLWRLWGLDPSETPTSSFTLGIDEPEVIAAKARTAAGWPILKVKLGVEPERERAILEAVRREAPDATLRVDANAGWAGADAALERIRVLEGFGVEFVEQPLPPEDREGLRRVADGSPMPVVLDESCRISADVPGLRGLCHGVNVKLAKCGGPREAIRAIHTARSCGLGVMLGCMVESTLGVAPAMHLAPLADWVDLDGPALLAEDPFRGPRLVDGRIGLGPEPGLGVEPRRAV